MPDISEPQREIFCSGVPLKMEWAREHPVRAIFSTDRSEKEHSSTSLSSILIPFIFPSSKEAYLNVQREKRVSLNLAFGNTVPLKRQDRKVTLVKEEEEKSTCEKSQDEKVQSEKRAREKSEEEKSQEKKDEDERVLEEKEVEEKSLSLSSTYSM